MGRMKRIHTVLNGDQQISACELQVLHTRSLQRLYGLRQLGFTDRVFIDASHSRLHHVFGVLACRRPGGSEEI
jgi:HD superfamily phosphohydrolase